MVDCYPEKYYNVKRFLRITGEAIANEKKIKEKNALPFVIRKIRPSEQNLSWFLFSAPSAVINTIKFDAAFAFAGIFFDASFAAYYVFGETLWKRISEAIECAKNPHTE